MEREGVLLHCDEALRLIEGIDDPVTRNLVNMAFVRFVQETYRTKRRLRPKADVDMLYVVTVLKEFFSEHDVLTRTLAGEKVGAWFDD